MFNYDIFVDTLDELIEDKEMKLRIRNLKPGTHKYSYKFVRARVSSSDKYPDMLQIRFGRGQAHPKAYSIEIIKEMDILSS